MIDVRRLAVTDRSERPLFACRTYPINGAVTPSLVVGPCEPNSRTCSLLHDVKYCCAKSAVLFDDEIGSTNLGQDERETETAASRQGADRFMDVGLMFPSDSIEPA
jgi:hypothetical protein